VYLPPSQEGFYEPINTLGQLARMEGLS